MRPSQTKMPVKIVGQLTALYSLTVGHEKGLEGSCSDPSVWQHLRVPWDRLFCGGIRNVVRALVDDADGGLATSYAIEFAGNIVGFISVQWLDATSIRFTTLIGTPWHGLGINTEAKLLILDAFFSSGGQSADFRVSLRNERALRAMQILGIRATGEFVDQRCGGQTRVMVFAVCGSDWPLVRQQMQKRLHVQTGRKNRMLTIDAYSTNPSCSDSAK